MFAKFDALLALKVAWMVSIQTSPTFSALALRLADHLLVHAIAVHDLVLMLDMKCSLQIKSVDSWSSLVPL